MGTSDLRQIMLAPATFLPKALTSFVSFLLFADGGDSCSRLRVVPTFRQAQTAVYFKVDRSFAHFSIPVETVGYFGRNSGRDEQIVSEERKGIWTTSNTGSSGPIRCHGNGRNKRLSEKALGPSERRWRSSAAIAPSILVGANSANPQPFDMRVSVRAKDAGLGHRKIGGTSLRRSHCTTHTQCGRKTRWGKVIQQSAPGGECCSLGIGRVESTKPKTEDKASLRSCEGETRVEPRTRTARRCIEPSRARCLEDVSCPPPLKSNAFHCDVISQGEDTRPKICPGSDRSFRRVRSNARVIIVASDSVDISIGSRPESAGLRYFRRHLLQNNNLPSGRPRRAKRATALDDVEGLPFRAKNVKTDSRLCGQGKAVAVAGACRESSGEKAVRVKDKAASGLCLSPREAITASLSRTSEARMSNSPARKPMCALVSLLGVESLLTS